MALQKDGYRDAIRGTTKVKVAIDEDGYIVAPGISAAGTKSFSFNIANADNSAEDNQALFDFFFGLINTGANVVDETTNQMQVTWSI